MDIILGDIHIPVWMLALLIIWNMSIAYVAGVYDGMRED